MKLTLKISAFFFFFFISLQFGYSKHIIGGEITYTCEGNNNYAFTMHIYRDCDGNGAAFDNPAIIKIYKGNQTSYTEALEVDISSVTSIPADLGPCLELLSEPCVEDGVYSFTAFLPEGPEIYHIVYQRCCRNNTITNIFDPANSGATYEMKLTPKAMEVCNDSPTFDDFPPTAICANQPIDFDHSATDPDGDQLVYEFCTPLLGGGPFGTPENPGDAGACDGVKPDLGSSCPPPFDEVQFLFPTYSALEPMAGNPVVSIDPVTGLISGSPTSPGQYVVGVCVKEYRNGILLSEVRRDFQFNVSICEVTVNAAIEHDEVIGDQQFVINSCGSNTVTFVNESTQQSNIFAYEWNFDIDGTTETFTDWSPEVTFPGIGTYQGILILNPGQNLCNDTADIYVNIYPDITADFSFAYDTCVAGPIQFTDASSSEAGPIFEWYWDFGDGNSTIEEHPSHLYEDPGDHQIEVLVTDENNCQDSLTQVVNWFPVPATIVIEPSSFEGCEPLPVFFNNLSTPIDLTYDIVWDFGDGTTSGEISPTHIYDEDGLYSISLEITSPIGCYTEAAWNDWVLVKPSPIADFTFSPNNPNNFNPTVDFENLSIDAAGWDWQFSDGGFSYEENPTYSFKDTGSQVIQLIAIHVSGCLDTAVQRIDVVPIVLYFLPNAFTPNYDSINDEFRGNGFFEGMQEFTFTIWNRWGELIFETNDPNEAWNGRKNNTGKMSQNGLYIVLVNYIGPRGDAVKLTGYATLIK